jgi:hypothetical protein
MDVRILAASTLLLLVATSAQGAIEAGDAEHGGRGGSATGRPLTFGALLDENRKLTLDRIELSLAPNGPLDFTFYILQDKLGGATGSVTWLADADSTLLFRQATLVDPCGPFGADFGADPLAGSFNASWHAAGPLGSAGPPGGMQGPGAGGIGSGGLGGAFGGVIQPTGPGNAGSESIPQGQTQALDSETMPHLPEPSTLAIFGLGSLGLAFPAFGRRFRRTA